MIFSKTVQEHFLKNIMTNKRYKMRRKEFHKSRRRLVMNICLLNFIWCQIIVPSNAATSTTLTSSESTTIIVNIPTQPNLESKMIYPDLPQNLSVKPYEVTHTPGALQLNVSWIPGARLPNDYSIKIRPINGNSANNTCHTTPCAEYGINGSLTWLLIPRSVSSVEGAGCSIKRRCSYNITLVANPWNGKDVTITDIHLPECVGEYCSCHHKSSLPKPIVNVTVKSNTVNVTWSLPNSPLISNDTKYLQYKISIGEQKVKSAVHSTWYYHNTSYFIEWKDSNIQWKLFNVSDPLNHTYQALVSIVDIKGCVGPYGNKTFEMKSEGDNVAEENTQIYILISIVIIALLVIAIFVVVWKRRATSSRPCCLKSLLANARGDQSLRRQQVWPPGPIKIDDK